MVLALLGLILLASMVFFVFNAGQHVTYRVEVQNAADNAAISGAGWVARSLNTVAMNNVEMSRLISLAAVMDAVPLGVEYTLIDQRNALASVEAQLDIGLGDAFGVEQALIGLVRPNLENQVALLSPLDDTLNGVDYDIAAMTFYQSASGQRGQIWQAVESLAALSAATMENLGLLAQFNAHRGAQIAQRDGGLESGGILLPWIAQVPWSLGSFEDFETVVADGRLPEGQDDPQFARGPFDVLFGMRQRGQASNREFVDFGSDVRHTSRRGVPAPQERLLQSATIDTYFTDGTYEFIRNQLMALGQPASGDLDGRARRSDGSFFAAPSPDVLLEVGAPLAPSQWATRVQFIANQKINFLYPGTAASNEQVIEPQWINSYNQALALVEDGQFEGTLRGMYLSFEFRRGVDPDGGQLPEELVAWGFKTADGPFSVSPNPQGTNEWQEVPGTDGRLWRLFAPDPPVGPDASEEQYIYYDLWVGLNTGEVREIRNPYNFDTADRSALPGPVAFAPDAFSFEGLDEFRLNNLTFVGIAHQPKEAAMVPEGFDEGRADTKLVALAQAEVFNNHSWDLWTQMWHAQLVPVQGLEAWMEALENPQGADLMPWLDENDLEAVTGYLQSVMPLADLMLEH